MSFSLSCSSWILVTESALLPLIQKEHFLNTQHSFCHSPQLSWGFSSVITINAISYSWMGINRDANNLSCETGKFPVTQEAGFWLLVAGFWLLVAG